MVRNRSVIGSKCSLSYGLLDKKTGPQDNSSPDRWTSILTGSDETCERGGSKMRLLRIDSSARKASVTRQLTARFAEEWKMKHPNGDVMHRDVSTPALPLITQVHRAQVQRLRRVA